MEGDGVNLKQTTKRSRRRRKKGKGGIPLGNSPTTKSRCKLGPPCFCAGSSGGVIIPTGRVDEATGDVVIGREGLTVGKIALHDLIEISLILHI